MKLDLFNNIFKSTKENNIIQSFIKELDEFFENNLSNNERNQVPLVQKILGGKTLTTRYRDEINVQRHDIIANYSKVNSNQGEFYYIYSKSSNNKYGIVIYKNGESGTDIWINENQLPRGAGVDSVLRVKKGKLVLDKNATEKIQEKLTEMIDKLLEEQNNRLEEQRVEGCFYRFVEKTGKTVWLINETNYTGECFQEIDFPIELSDKATKKTIFQYINGEYRLVDN